MDEDKGTANGHKPTVRRVETLVVGDRTFESNGFCYVKTTHDGQVEILEFPIRSAGIKDILERVRKDAPQAPKRQMMVSGDTDVGRSLNVPRGQRKAYYMFDLTDEEYVKALDAHAQRTMFEIINQGLAVNFVDKDGKPVSATEALQTMRMSLAQFNEIQEAIENLTKSTDEEREGFTGRRSSSATTLATPTA